MMRTVVVSSPVQIPSSPTLSIEVTDLTPPITRSKRKGKIGKSIWDDPATALGRAHNMITNEELKGLSSVSSHELVSCHIHKLVQVWIFPIFPSFNLVCHVF